ncbi:hypothetical protein [Spartinivicinus ruber]|uniref:hypothetical protein n=1 Tax=Spartinivicinus ruber TaxID=2683272 RepID=UPI0013D3EE16|nr:hypothetical protein [Spartinivicinus ruber]
MVRKLVVLLSSTVFFSSQITANTDDVIEFLPGKNKLSLGYLKGRFKNSMSNNNEYQKCVLGRGSYPITALEYSLELTPIKENRKIINGLLANQFSGSLSSALSTGLFSFTKNYLTDKEQSKYCANSKPSLDWKDFLFCKGYTLEEIFLNGYYGDFNGDNLGDVIYQINHKFTSYSLLVFYGTNKTVNTVKKNHGSNHLTQECSKRLNQIEKGEYPYAKAIETIDGVSLKNVTIQVQDRNKDGRDDLLITRPGAPDLIAFAAEDGSFPKAEVDTGIGKYNGPSLYKSRFCNRALLTQHPDENPSTVLFDDICRTAYVSPPATGTTEVTALTPDPDNAAFCPKLASVQTNQTELLKELGQANTKFKTIMGSLPHDTQLMTYATTREQAFNDLLAAEQAEAAVRKTVLSQRRTIGQLELDVEDCALLGTDCNTAQHQLNAAQQALTQLLTELDAAVEARLVKQQVYDQAFDAYGEALDNYLTVDTELAALIEEFKALQDKELALYREFAGLEGATAQIQYQWDWAEQVNRYQALNQSLKMQWQPLPVTGAKILAELQEKPETPLGDKAITLPAVLYTSIDDPAANVKINGYETALMPKGDAVITSTLRKEPSNPISLPSKINGTVGLSLAGYCPFAPSANQPQPIENLAAHLTPHIQYEYEEQIKRGYTAKYKLDTFVKTIVRTKKKKKWFKKKKKTYIERKVITSDWFNIQFDASSGEYTYSPAEQDQITREVKSDLVRRVNTAIGALYADNSQCQQNKDCSYGYWLGQLTGNNDDTKAIQQFKQGNSKWVEEVVYGIRYRPKTGWVGFR